MQKLSLLAIQLMARNRLFHFVTIILLHQFIDVCSHVVTTLYSYFLTRFLVIPVLRVIISSITFMHDHCNCIVVKFEKLVGELIFST